MAVPSPWSVNVTPPGSTLAGMLSAAAGKPVVVTVNVPAVPTVNVAAAALVMAGAWSTVSVKGCVAGQCAFSWLTAVGRSGSELLEEA